MRLVIKCIVKLLLSLKQEENKKKEAIRKQNSFKLSFAQRIKTLLASEQISFISLATYTVVHNTNCKSHKVLENRANNPKPKARLHYCQQKLGKTK